MTIKLMKAINYVVIFILVNVLWVLGVVSGLFFIGLVPSTYAVISIYQEQELFDGYSSYLLVVKKFIGFYKKALKKLRWSILIYPTMLFIVHFDLLVVQNNALMKAIFLWPLLFLLFYLALVTIQYIYMNTISQDSIKAKVKAAFAAPLLLPLESLLSMLAFGSFYILCLRYNWLFFCLISCLLFLIMKLLERGYERKKLVM